MQRYLLFILSFFLLSSIFSLPVSAHEEHEHKDAKYTVTTEQQPLSPFVGEKVTITFIVTDKEDKPAKELAGNLLIKKITAKQYTDKTSEQQEEVIFTQPAKTDDNGMVSLSYTFTNEGLYDAEFLWGSDPETDSAGKQIFAREPSSFFLPQELMKRVWLFIGIALVGIVIGAAGAVIILTVKLHKRK